MLNGCVGDLLTMQMSQEHGLGGGMKGGRVRIGVLVNLICGGEGGGE